MTKNECDRCGTLTRAPYVTTTGELGFDGWLCDDCRESFREWVDGDAQRDVQGGVTCGKCSTLVYVTVRPVGPDSGPTLLLSCPACGWDRSAQYLGE